MKMKRFWFVEDKTLSLQDLTLLSAPNLYTLQVNSGEGKISYWNFEWIHKIESKKLGKLLMGK